MFDDLSILIDDAERPWQLCGYQIECFICFVWIFATDPRFIFRGTSPPLLKPTQDPHTQVVDFGRPRGRPIHRVAMEVPTNNSSLLSTEQPI